MKDSGNIEKRQAASQWRSTKIKNKTMQDIIISALTQLHMTTLEKEY